MIFDISICQNERQSPINQNRQQSENQNTYADDVRSPGLGSEHAQNPRSTSNIKHRLAFEKVRVIDDRGSVGSRSDCILQHLLVNAYSTHRKPRSQDKASDHMRKIKPSTHRRSHWLRCTSHNTRWSERMMDSHRNARTNRHSYQTKKRQTEQHPNLGYQYQRVIATFNETKRAFSERNNSRRTY